MQLCLDTKAAFTVFVISNIHSFFVLEQTCLWEIIIDRSESLGYCKRASLSKDHRSDKAAKKKRAGAEQRGCSSLFKRRGNRSARISARARARARAVGGASARWVSAGRIDGGAGSSRSSRASRTDRARSNARRCRIGASAIGGTRLISGTTSGLRLTLCLGFVTVRRGLTRGRRRRRRSDGVGTSASRRGV